MLLMRLCDASFGVGIKPCDYIAKKANSPAVYLRITTLKPLNVWRHAHNHV